jgi:P4 family phage/plasmid primase-like protien
MNKDVITLKKIEELDEHSYIKKNFFDWMFKIFKYNKDDISQIENSGPSHSSIGEPSGSFYISDDKLDIFYNKYFSVLEKLKDCQPENKLHLVEMHKDMSPILIDLDIHMTLNNDRKYDLDFIKNIVVLYNEKIQEILTVDNKDLIAYIFEKKKPTLNKTNTSLKDGIHIIYPKIITKPEIQYYIREQILRDKNKLNSIFQNIPIINPYSDIFDKAVIYDAGWQLYGSCKPKSLGYELTYTIDNNEIIQNNISFNLELIQLLSIRNKYKLSTINNNEKLIQFINKGEENNKSKKDKKKYKTFSCITEHNIFGRDSVYQDLNDYIIPCCDLLLNNKEIQDDYFKWIKYGWILHNIHNVKCLDSKVPDNILLDKWIELSKKSPKYIEGECEKRWNDMICKDLGPGTLFMWAREYNYEDYLKITRGKLIDKQITEICKNKKPTEKDIINLVYIVKNGYEYNHKKIFNPDEMSIICAANTRNIWYEYSEDKHRWIKDQEDGHCLRLCLSTEIDELLWDKKIEEEVKAKNNKECDFTKGYHEFRAKVLEQSREKCDTAAGNESLMRMAKTKFTVERTHFFNKLDENPFLINFTNGVYDLKNLEFRKGKRDDLITQSCNLEYKQYEMDSIEIKTIEKFLFSILPENDVREYALIILGSCISGDIRSETFHIFTGGGGNGKSKLLDLVSAVLGDFYTIMNVSSLTTKRNGSASADPELAGCQGKRLVLFQEVEKDQIVNTSKLKEWTGGDEISVRGLYKDPVKFKPQFKSIMTANNVPAFDSHDDGTWRRVKIVPFKTRFVNEEDYEDDKSISNLCRDFKGKEDRPTEYHCIRDNKLIEEVMQYKEAFMFYLLQYYNKYYNIMKNGTNIHEPWPVIEITEKIRAENNIYKSYFDVAIDISSHYEDEYFDDIWTNFREYFTESGGDKKRCPKKKEFVIEFANYYEKIITYHKLYDPNIIKDILKIKNNSNVIVPYLKIYKKPEKKKKKVIIKPEEIEYYESE